MSIHSEHPFATPEEGRSPLRRLRGRLPAPVSIWAAGAGLERAGWTVSSFLLADGEPGEVLGLVDPDSELADVLPRTGTVAVSLLGWPHRELADAFAGLAPAPGGPFRLASWTETEWGPVLRDAVGWIGVRLAAPPDGHAGWGLLVRGVVERLEVAAAAPEGVLASFRGRYRPIN